MIKIVNLKKKFDSKWISNGINLTIPKGKMTCIIGRSGEGKSVLLKQMIGLIKPTSGQIFINDIDITTLKEKDQQQIFKKCGYVFQFAALLDSLTIFENVGLTLLENGITEDKALAIVKEKLTLVNLGDDILHKYPSELSGGMRKRVGLARTLVNEPEIIFYDEPTTGLDPITSRLVYELMLHTQKQLHVTSIIISHDIEIFNYVDYIALLQNGIIEYFSEAKDIWKTDNPFVKEFISRL